MKETESRYSQDQDWNVHEPEEAQFSETELAEIRRLQDSTSRAEGLAPSAPVLTPVLPPPRIIQKLPTKYPTIPQVIEFEELVPFFERFPETFQKDTLQAFVSDRWKQFDPALYTADEMVIMILALEMQRLVALHQLPEDHPCQIALRKFTIRFLKSHFPTMRLLIEVLLISARDLKLPETTAKEKAETTALDYLIEFLETSELTPTLIPPSSKIEKSLSEALLKAILPLVHPSVVRPLSQKLILALNIEQAAVDYIEKISSLTCDTAEVKPSPFLETLTTPEKATMLATLLIPLREVKFFIIFLIAFLREISENDDGNELAEGFLYGIEMALSDVVSESTINEVIKSLYFIGRVMGQTALFHDLTPNQGIRKILEDFVQRLETPHTKFAQKTSTELKKQLNLINPSQEQARDFAQTLLQLPKASPIQTELSA